MTEPISIEENVQAYPSKWCKNVQLHVPHIIARKEEDQQLYHYYCPGTWE